VTHWTRVPNAIPEADRIPDLATPLLLTKYARPPVPTQGMVRRADLLALLAGSRGIVLVSAPPGYGKTTLVAGWLDADDRSAAWLTLDESDNDPAVFVAYLVAAVRRIISGLDAGLEQALAAPPISTTSLAPLLNALDQAGKPIAIVLDDYHLVTSPAIHEITAILASHLPLNVRLVIVTRHDPPLPLARLRVRGQLTEIRATDLRFSPADALRFLGESMGVQLSQQAAERLTERTEGWIAGLQLAGLSLRESLDPDGFIEAFGSSDRYIFDYLTDEALANQPPDVRAFLETTCVLHRLSGPLCDALTGRSDGAEMLVRLADANVFLTPLDERRAWFRYHRLFADLLASNLSGAQAKALHRAAAAWFAAHDMSADGIRHYLAAEEPEEAARLMEGVAEITLARGELRTVGAWCDALPAASLAAHPVLGVLRAWVLFLLGDLAGAEAALAQLGDDEGRDGSSGPRRACLEAWFANRHDRGDAEILARRAIDGIPERDPLFRSLAFTTLGESLVARDVRRSVEAFEEAHRLAQVAGRSALLAGTVYSLATADLFLGRRREAEALCRQTIADLTGRAVVTPPWLGMLHYPLGIARFEADDLVQARQHIATGHELVDRAGLRVTMLGAAEWYEILGLHLLGEQQQAWRRLEAVRQEGEHHGIGRVVTAMGLLGAELLLLEGEPARASGRLDELPSTSDHVLGWTRDRIRLTRARVLLANGRSAEALEIAQRLSLEQLEGARLGRRIPTLIVLAEASDRNAAREAGLAVLAEAVTHAADEDYRRAFLDTIFPIGHLLARVRHANPAFVDSLLGTAGVERYPPGASSSPVRRPSEPGDGAGPVEPLSVRELEVLRLVAAGLSNEEIGRQLYVSSGTAKWHVHNVLAKLGARNRVGLVARARSLGLL
jgi:LuxR family transcriptional regulator, maltose regulon positive regulatory protein